ncbi:tripartite tricarboxylate transporter substrate-binding protein [uncultured Enterovirga sp.]|uniref:tripartite tricarboxylate transporter substrate-binding protein n=1 Tax=uncultured Enterovirga sp. TaxID=2026352 RepID=UPI0035CB9FF6
MRGRLWELLACGLALGVAGPAPAQDYPARPITVIVPYTAGGPTDVVTRLLGQAMGASLKQQIVVENVGGAAGTVGAARAARSPPDGYTLFLHNIGHATAPALYRGLSYDPITDFEPIGLVVDVPQAMVAKNANPARSLPELVTYLKANRDRVNLAHSGRGSGSHLCALLLMGAIDAKLTEVAYKGTGPAITDLMGGQVDVMCDQVSNTGNQIKAGTIRGYCVTTRTRVASLPDLPPCADAGLPGFEASVWHGLYAPKGTPPAIIGRVNEALRAALRDPTVKQRLAELGAEPVAESQVTPAALRTHLGAQVDQWAAVIRAAKLLPE